MFLISAALKSAQNATRAFRKLTTPYSVDNKSYYRSLVPGVTQFEYERPLLVHYLPEEAPWARAIGIPAILLLVFEVCTLFIVDLALISRQLRRGTIP